jgi:hypothetical protein
MTFFLLSKIRKARRDLLIYLRKEKPSKRPWLICGLFPVQLRYAHQAFINKAHPAGEHGYYIPNMLINKQEKIPTQVR